MKHAARPSRGIKMIRSTRDRIGHTLLLLGCAASLTCGQAAAVPHSAERWTASWAASQQAVCDVRQLPQTSFAGATLRQSIHLSAGGKLIRLHLSNLFGHKPLDIAAVTVASGDPAKPGAMLGKRTRSLTFGGNPRVTIAPGSEVVSDPASFAVAPLSTLLISANVLQAPSCITSHPGSRATSFLLAGGRSAEKELVSDERIEHWYFISALDVAGDKTNGTVVAFGDSITDGHGATTDGNDRWSDVLATRLASSHMAVVNAGIGGNRILGDGLGPSARSRFERDALDINGVRAVILLEGVNDLGGLDRIREHPQGAHDALVAQLQTAMEEMVNKAHRKGVCVLGGTVMPYVGSGYYHPSTRSEADRKKLNAWIRSSGVFDGVVDFDQVLRDPQYPERLSSASGTDDLLHPGPAGYRIMGEAVSRVALPISGCTTTHQEIEEGK